jgi:hypothetical protein
VVEAYAGNASVTFIGIDYGLGNSSAIVEAWIEGYGWTFSVGINDEENEIYKKYGFSSGGFDTFFVIDGDRAVTFIEGYGNSSADFPRIREAIDGALGSVPVEPTTWGKIKSIYREEP